MPDTSSSSGIGVLVLLGVAFVVLKLTGVISWSWWWITAPLLGWFASTTAIILAVAGAALLATLWQRAVR